MKQVMKRALSCLITFGLIALILVKLSPLFRPEDTEDCKEKNIIVNNVKKVTIIL